MRGKRSRSSGGAWSTDSPPAYPPAVTRPRRGPRCHREECQMNAGEARDHIANKVGVTGAMVALAKARVVHFLQELPTAEAQHNAGLAALDAVLGEMAPEAERGQDRRHLAPVPIDEGDVAATLH